MNYIIVLGNSKEHVMFRRLDIAIQEFNKQVETNTYYSFWNKKRNRNYV